MCRGHIVMTSPPITRVYEVRPRKDKRGVDLISDVLPFGRLRYDTPDNAIGYALHSSRSHAAVIRVDGSVGNAIKTHEHKGDFNSERHRVKQKAAMR